MCYDTIVYDVEDKIATIILNRPEVLNAISKRMQAELDDAFSSADHDPTYGR